MIDDWYSLHINVFKVKGLKAYLAIFGGLLVGY